MTKVLLKTKASEVARHNLHPQSNRKGTPRMNNPNICEIEGCDKHHDARGWCSMHYQRWQKYGNPMGGNSRFKTPEESFEARTMWEPNSGCLIWTGHTNNRGYGTIMANGKLQRTHRYAWEQSNGIIPEGMHVLHRCDNPPCCNPYHLFLGTHQDNMDDMIKKGRKNPPKGERVNTAKLTETDVIAIRADIRLQKEIAVDYGVGETTIGRLKRRITWKHI